MNIALLREKMRKNGYSVKRLSSEMPLHKATFYRKLKRGGDFGVDEARRISDLLGFGMEERAQIFLAN